MTEKVDHPAHYNAHPSGVECIDVVEYMGFNLGNAIKYIWRADEKGQRLGGSTESALVRRAGDRAAHQGGIGMSNPYTELGGQPSPVTLPTTLRGCGRPTCKHEDRHDCPWLNETNAGKAIPCGCTHVPKGAR